MASKRILQISEQIRDFISMMLVRGELSDPRIKNLTINSVNVTPDLQTAKVYYTVFGDEKSKKDAQKGLEHASGFIRKELAQALKIRYTPQIKFFFDESVEHGARINELLLKIQKNEESE